MAYTAEPVGLKRGPEFWHCTPYAVKFMRKVGVTDYCWIWHGAIIKNSGYGQVRLPGGRCTTAHRAALEVLDHHDPVPREMDVDHLCRNKLCVRPSHLEVVSPTENRKRQGSAVTHCPRGHEYNKENTRINKTKTGFCRKCKACELISNRTQREKRKWQSEK